MAPLSAPPAVDEVVTLGQPIAVPAGCPDAFWNVIFIVQLPGVGSINVHAPAPDRGCLSEYISRCPLAIETLLTSDKSLLD